MAGAESSGNAGQSGDGPASFKQRPTLRRGTTTARMICVARFLVTGRAVRGGIQVRSAAKTVLSASALKADRGVCELIAKILELQWHFKFGFLEQGNGGLQIVTLLAADA